MFYHDLASKFIMFILNMVGVLLRLIHHGDLINGSAFNAFITSHFVVFLESSETNISCMDKGSDVSELKVQINYLKIMLLQCVA